MSDFVSSFWSLWVIVLTVASIAGCAILLVATGRIKVTGKAGPKDAGGNKAEVTGHVWDDDLQEYNNPLPKWWNNLFWITIIFGVVYLILYPGLGSLPGVLGWTSTGAYKREVSDFDDRLKPLYEKYAKMDVEQIAADPAAKQTGQRLFLTYCSPCHGSDAMGGKGFPNLADKNWLYGGAPENIMNLALTELRRRRIGFVFQFFNLIPVLDAVENAALPLTLDGASGAEKTATGWLTRVGLADRLHNRPDQLSGGQQQRVAVARALSTDPALVLADEPTGNLDSKAGTEIAELLSQVAREWHRSVLMVTHDPRIASYAQRLVLMQDGRVVDDLALDGSRSTPLHAMERAGLL